jgi:hypothetical protein
MSEENGKPERKKATGISRATAFVVYKWLKKNREDLASRKLTIDQIDDEAARSCQVAGMTRYNVRSICRDFGVDPMWARGTGGGVKGQIIRGQMSRFVAGQVLQVCGELDRVCRLLGEAFDPDKTIDLANLRLVSRGHSPVGQDVDATEPAA